MQRRSRVEDRVKLAGASEKVKLFEVVAERVRGQVPIDKPHRLLAGIAHGVDGARGNNESVLYTEIAPAPSVEDPQAALDHPELVRLARMEVTWWTPPLSLEYELDVEGLRGRIGRCPHDRSPHPEPRPEVQAIALT